MPVGEQIAILYCGTKGLMSAVPVDKVRECQDSFLETMRNQHQDVLDFLGSGQIDDASTNVITETMANVSESYKA